MMRKLLVTAFVVALTAAVFSTSAFAATHKFTLTRESTLSGIQLEKGKYKLELNGTEATITQKGRVVATAQVEIRDAKPANPGSVLVSADGALKEIRLKNQVVVFAR